MANTSIIQHLVPIGPGSIPDPYLTLPERGFFPEPDTYDMWETVVNELVIDYDNQTTSGGYSGWAVTDESVEVSINVTDFEGPDNAIIDWIKVTAQCAGGQVNGQDVVPTGAGNTFNLGIRCGTPAVNYAQSVTIDKGDVKLYSATFYNKDGVNIFTPKDLANLEYYMSYGYYWVTDDKGYPKNDNAHNILGQIYLDVSYRLPRNNSSSILIQCYNI